MQVEIYILVDHSKPSTRVDVFGSEPDAILAKNRRDEPSKVEIFKKKIDIPT
ncbi:hypothetical protein [Lyngbya sp. CCY1209]|uniref:hypothetical protein n=1 Tax=Lyngbya sp. CCY1209 TaxID=2886103 RepID=UPI002D21036D|nr:hypothetical protein [Lyngbya sp. CCY1209]MEB3882411.1 hypothetical protein [Lyngbya sp. CCY1209]